MADSRAVPITGGHVVAEVLRRRGVEAVFSVPGESFLDLLDGLRDSGPPLVVCRHEASAANMAVAAGKLTGRHGVCLVSRGPGAMHAAIGVHIARQDSVPFVLLVGQVPRANLGREAFQEIDYAATFGSQAKWAAQVGAPEELSPMVERAFEVAASGRPGPVVLALPEDVLASPVPAAVAVPPALRVAPPPLEAVPDQGAMQQLMELLQTARRPLVVAGGTGWSPEVADGFRHLVERTRLPVLAAFRAQDVLDNRSPSYVGALGVGSPGAVRGAVANCDLLIAIGTRIDEMTAGGYRVITPPRGPSRLILVHPAPEELPALYEPDVTIQATSGAFVAAATPLSLRPAWSEWTADHRARYEASRCSAPIAPLDLAAVVRHVSDEVTEDAVISNGAGSYTGWVHRYHQFKRFGTQLAPVAGAMGFGLPAAIAATVLNPGRKAICYAGDGCFQMSAHELATAVGLQLPVVVLLVNNCSYGSIREHQERQFPGRSFGTDLTNPDFVAFAQAFGAGAERVLRTEDFPGSFARALAAKGPYLIELPVDRSVRLV